MTATSNQRTDLKELNNKTALVTGANRGIGAAISLELARTGAFVAINYFRSDDRVSAEALRTEIARDGGKAVTVCADVTQRTEVAGMFSFIAKEIGPVDVLVNNAAVESRKSTLDFTEAEYAHILATNLTGSFLCAQRALLDMKAAGWGRIINISSIHEVRPTGFCTPYSMSKGAMMMMMRELAFEFGPFGITVNNVAPGAIRTDMNRAVLSDAVFEAQLIAKTPSRLIGLPEDVARAVVFLAVPAARFITGTTLFVDGGLSI